VNFAELQKQRIEEQIRARIPTRFNLGFAFSWLLVSAFLVPLVVISGSLSWLESLALLVPLTALYSAVCRSSQYIPVPELPGKPWVRAHFFIVPALVASALCTLAAALAAPPAARFLGSDTLVQRFDALLPLLFGVGVLIYLLYAAFNELTRQSERSRQAEIRAMEATSMAREAELRALKAQVNPHFLFNSLHSISALTTVDAERARETCILLADFLRSTLGLGDKPAITLQEELDLTAKYMAVEKVRFGSRLSVDETVEPDTLDVLVPPLLLQPLFENAVKHGVSAMAEGGWLRLRARVNDGRLVIELTNSFDPEAPVRRGQRVGVKNVQRRLESRYGDQAGLVPSTEEGVWRVKLWLPAERKAPA
jgi:hypothetical protein